MSHVSKEGRTIKTSTFPFLKRTPGDSAKYCHTKAIRSVSGQKDPVSERLREWSLVRLPMGLHVTRTFPKRAAAPQQAPRWHSIGLSAYTLFVCPGNHREGGAGSHFRVWFDTRRLELCHCRRGSRRQIHMPLATPHPRGKVRAIAPMSWPFEVEVLTRHAYRKHTHPTWPGKPMAPEVQAQRPP